MKWIGVAAIVAIVLWVSLVSAATISFNFDTSQNVTLESPTIIYSSSVVFQVTTTTSVLCRYNEDDDIPFESMTGSFDENLETVHKKYFTDLPNGVYRLYVRCRDINDLDDPSDGVNRLEAVFKISNPMAGQVILDNTILNAGKHEVTLITTKTPLSTPKLSYTYDGIVYKPIALFGSGSSWKGYLLISDSLGEEVGSFKFEATDLEGKVGTEIVGESVFIVDTDPPKTLASVSAAGEYERIRIEWYVEEDEEIEAINVYRSESPGVDLTDHYKKITDPTKEEYLDTDVTKGKTYYYRVAPEDEAGNLADFSPEVKATALLDNTTSTSGLSAELFGVVDSLLSEIDILESDISSAQSSFSSQDESEEYYFELLDLDDAISSAQAELKSLRKEVEDYKLIDLSETALNTRIGSSRVKLSVIRKKVPEEFATLASREIANSVEEESIRESLLRYVSGVETSLVDRSVRESLSFFEEKDLVMKSKLHAFEIIYLDGTKASRSVVEHTLDSTLVKSENTFFLVTLPTTINTGSLVIKNSDYTVESDGLLRFETDTKQITYIVDQEVEEEVLSDITVAPIVLVEESTSLTGYFLSDIPGSDSLGMSFLILIVAGMTGYLFFIKKQQKKNVSFSFLDKAKTVKRLQEEGKEAEAANLYESLKVDYLSLSPDEKKMVFKEVKHLTKK